jgi:hypothetical protein
LGKKASPFSKKAEESLSFLPIPRSRRAALPIRYVIFDKN